MKTLLIYTSQVESTNDESFLESHADLSEKKYPEKDYCFVEWLTRVKKLAAIPPSAFYSAEDKHLGENYIRFCFIKASSPPASCKC